MTITSEAILRAQDQGIDLTHTSDKNLVNRYSVELCKGQFTKIGQGSRRVLRAHGILKLSNIVGGRKLSLTSYGLLLLAELDNGH